MKSGRKKLEGNVIDLHARRIFPGRIEWAAGRIERIVPLPGRRFRHYISPGFVDAHIHIESSLLPPAEFARWAVVHGTAGTVSDPHEIANVLGVAGVDYMVAEAARRPLKVLLGAPSCVPATCFETAGAVLDAEAVGRLLAKPEIGYLSEVMNFPGVLAGDPGLLAMIAAAKAAGKPVDGHAPGLVGRKARDYAAAGITTDHECLTITEALGKLKAGMKILIREGSAARNFAALEPLLKTHPEQCMFCCDDLHPDLLMKRHIDEHVRRALRGGAERFDVLRCACVNPVFHYKMDIGLLREGDPADFIVFEGWKNLRVKATYLCGECVAREGRSLLRRVVSARPNAFAARKRSPEDFRIGLAEPAGLEPTSTARGRRVKRVEVSVIGAINGQLMTRHLRQTVPVKDGALVAEPQSDLLKIAVVNRYAAAAPVSIGFIRGFGLKEGAIASSVAHDSHNIVAVGADDASLCRAVNAVIGGRGGISVVDTQGITLLALPIAGLMAAGEGRTVAERYTQLDKRAKALGSKLDAPFMTLSFMALLVIPDLKLSDVGLFSGESWGFVPLQGEMSRA